MCIDKTVSLSHSHTIPQLTEQVVLVMDMTKAVSIGGVELTDFHLDVQVRVSVSKLEVLQSGRRFRKHITPKPCK